MDHSELQPRFAIIASTQKMADRFLYTGSLPNEANSPLSLLYSIEVTRAWFPSSRLIPTITAVLGERFNTIQRSSNPLKSFEATIKHINEELYALAEQGETEWIGHLNALLALVDNNEVHISQTGTSTAYLFRQRRISQVTEANDAEAEPHPLNTFSNIISGQLVEGDRLVLSNQDLFTLVSLDHIRSAVTDQSPYVAASQITRSVKRTKVSSVSTIIVAIEKPATWKEAGDEPLVINLEESMQAWHKKAWKTVKPVVIKAGELSKKAWQVTKTGAAKANQKWQSHYGPKTKEWLRQSSAKISEKVKNSQKGNERLASVLAKADQAIGQKIKPLNKKVKPYFEKLVAVNNYLGRLIEKIKPYTAGKNTRYTIAGLAVILLVWSLVSIRNRHNEQQLLAVRSENDGILNQVQELAGKTDVAIQLSQKVEAQKLIVEAQQKLASIQNPTTTQTEQRNSLLNIIREKGDKLTKTRRLNATTTFNTPAQTDFIVASDKGIFTFSKESNSGRYIARDLSQSELPFNLESGDDKPVSATYDREKDEVFVLTANRKVFGVRLENDAISVRKRENPMGDFAESNFIRTFGENLYLLSNKDGLLWKYPPSGDNYAKGVNQIDPGQIDLKGATDLAIDGYVYILKASGTVDKLLRGERVADFNVREIPESGHTPNFTSLTTLADGELLYLFDNDNSNTKSSRLVLLNKDKGDYSSQIAFSEEHENVKSFSIDEVNKRFWLLVNNTIFEYKY